MSSELEQKASKSLKISQSALVLMLLSMLLGTFLRISLLPLYPLVALIVFIQLRLRVSKDCLNLLALIFLCLILSLFNGIYLKYNLLSLFYMIPFLFLLFSNPGRYDLDKKDLVKIFMNSLTFVAVVNNIVGFIQVIRHPGSDDSFIGIYSTFSISMNGLSLLNAVIFTYYFHLYLISRTRKHLLWAIFFLISFVLGFYGAGLMVFIGAFILVFYKWKFINVLKIVFISVFSLLILYYLIAFVKPSALAYNMANIKKLTSFDVQHGPRKLIVFYNYSISYPKDIKDFLFGSGPGTFNSRSAFITGSPSYFSGVGILKSTEQPYYFKNYAYTLWNDSVTSQALYLDGFRNQPFSSLLAFLGEYGFIFTVFWAWYYYKYYKTITKKPVIEVPAIYFAYLRLTKFLFCFLLLLLLIDNFFEYPEIMLLILVSLKLLHIEMFKMSQLAPSSNSSQ